MGFGVWDSGFGVRGLGFGIRGSFWGGVGGWVPGSGVGERREIHRRFLMGLFGS